MKGGHADLRAFLADLERAGDLARIAVPVDPRLEIAEIAGRVVRSDGPALLFERPIGSRFPVAANLFGSMRRIEIALGRPPEAVGEELARLVERLQPPSLGALWRSRRTLRRLLAARTRPVGRAPSQEVEAPVDLSALPVITSWPRDAGPFLTFPLVLTIDPATGRRNLGVYRMQVMGKDRTGMHWQIAKGGSFHHHEAERSGRAMPVAVAVGADPCLMLAAVTPLPENIDELAFAGFLRGRPTRIARGAVVPIDVPAQAEFVLEGEVLPGEREVEGPFGDHFGHYSHAAPFPVFRVRRISHRRDAVYVASVVGRPPQEDRAMGDAAQLMLLPLLRLIHPEVRDLWAYYQAGFHGLAVAAVAQRYGKEAVKAALGLLGAGQMALAKCLVMVDGGVDVRDFRAVLRAIAANFDPAHDFLLLPRTPFDTLDFSSMTPNLGSKMVLDATSDGGAPAAPEPPRGMDVGALDPRVRGARLLEGTLLCVVASHADARPLLDALVARGDLGGVRIVAVVSEDVDLSDDEALLWGLFTRFDPARDVVFAGVEVRGAWTACRGRMGIDATFKPGFPDPVVMDPDVVLRVDERWGELFPGGRQAGLPP